MSQEKSDLANLKEIYEAGYITEEEYKRRRQEILLTSGKNFVCCKKKTKFWKKFSIFNGKKKQRKISNL